MKVTFLLILVSSFFVAVAPNEGKSDKTKDRWSESYGLISDKQNKA